MEERTASKEYVISYEELKEKLGISETILFVYSDKDNKQLKIFAGRRIQR